MDIQLKRAYGILKTTVFALTCALVTTGLIAKASFAADPNISTPLTVQQKEYKNSGAGGNQRGGRRRQFGKISQFPGWQQIGQLPSLTASQRTEIQTIYRQAKDDAKPEVEQLKAINEQFRNSIKRAGDQKSQTSFKENRQKWLAANPDILQKFIAIRSHLKSQRKEVWQKVKEKLTPSQLQQLKPPDKEMQNSASPHEG